MTEKNLITIEELATILNVPKSWIYQRTRLGTQHFPHIKLGKYLRFEIGEVLEFLKTETVSRKIETINNVRSF